MRVLVAFIIAFSAKRDDWGAALVAVIFLLGWKAISIMRERKAHP